MKLAVPLGELALMDPAEERLASLVGRGPSSRHVVNVRNNGA